MAWTAPRTWVAGETVTAAIMNTHVRDNLNAIGGAWVSYVPAWGALTTAPTLGNGTIAGSWLDRGNTFDFVIKLSPGSTTTYGSGAYTFTLPAALNAAMATANTGLNVNGTTLDTGVAVYPLLGRVNSSTTIIMDVAATGAAMSPTVPFTLGSGDMITIHGAGLWKA